MIDRRRKIPLANALGHKNDDFSGTCENCKRHKVIKHREMIDFKIPTAMRLDEVEGLFRCTRCGEKAITFQLTSSNVPFSRYR